MSELRADTITASDGSSPVTLTKQSAAKAWASFDQGASGHPVYTDASLNTASTTDVANGVTKLTFTNSLDNADYAISGVCQVQDAGGTVFGVWGKSTTNSRQMTTSDFHTENRVSSATPTDSDYTAYKVLGDLA